MTNKIEVGDVDVERMMELEEKNSSGPDPRLTPDEERQLQELLDRNYRNI